MAPVVDGVEEEVVFFRLEGEARGKLMAMELASGIERELARMPRLFMPTHHLGWAICGLRVSPGGLDAVTVERLIQPEVGESLASAI